MKSSGTLEKRTAGRPLSFERGEALRKAMLLFWRFGYEGTSVQALTEAMGITPPSLYAAFGDKKKLFLEAVHLYTSGGPETAIGIIKSAPSARAAVWKLLEGSAITLTGVDTPPGCMLISSATNCSPGSADVQAALAHLRIANEEALKGRIQSEVDAGPLPASANAEALASLYMGVIQGMSTQARDGSSRAKLMAMSEAAMMAWPKPIASPEPNIAT